jgi:hypothetical protein
MRIETRTTLIFTITSDNPPHETAVDFIKAAAKIAGAECHKEPSAMSESRTTEFRVTDGNADALRSFASDVRRAMDMIGVLMSEAE